MITDRQISIKVQFGDYIISIFDDDSMWLAHIDGEGMQVKNEDIAKLLEKYLEENF